MLRLVLVRGESGLVKFWLRGRINVWRGAGGKISLMLLSGKVCQHR
jgi:hypothetical protein